MKRQILLLAAIFFAVFVISSMGTPGGAIAGPVKLSYANFPPPVTFPCVQMERWYSTLTSLPLPSLCFLAGRRQ